MSADRFLFNAVKIKEGDPLSIQINFYQEEIDVVSEIARDLAKQGWDVKTLRETLLPWDLTQS